MQHSDEVHNNAALAHARANGAHRRSQETLPRESHSESADPIAVQQEWVRGIPCNEPVGDLEAAASQHTRSSSGVPGSSGRRRRRRTTSCGGSVASYNNTTSRGHAPEADQSTPVLSASRPLHTWPLTHHISSGTFIENGGRRHGELSGGKYEIRRLGSDYESRETSVRIQRLGPTDLSPSGHTPTVGGDSSWHHGHNRERDLGTSPEGDMDTVRVLQDASCMQARGASESLSGAMERRAQQRPTVDPALGIDLAEHSSSETLGMEPSLCARMYRSRSTYSETSTTSQRVKLGRDPSIMETSFSPVNVAWEANGHISRDMPADLYSASILCMMNAKDKRDFLRICLPMILLMCMATLLQIFLLENIMRAIIEPGKRTSGSHEGYCLQSNTLLRNVCLITYVAVCFRHIRETIKMYWWLAVFRFEWSKTEHQPLRLTCEELRDPEGGLTVATVRPVTHISGPEGVAYLMILLMKLGAEVFAMFVGSGGVLLSASELDLILNTLAATFILELDDLLHDVFVARMWEAFCRAPEITAAVRGWVVNAQLAYPYVAVLIIGGVSAGMIITWCGFTNSGTGFRDAFLSLGSTRIGSPPPPVFAPAAPSPLA